MNLFPAAALTDAEAVKADADTPENALAKIGSRLQLLEQRTVHVQVIDIAADASGAAAKPFIPEVSGEIVDAWAVCSAANASGTLTLRRSTTAITSAIVCAVQDVLARTTTLVQAQKTAVQGEALNVIANGAADRGRLFVAIRRS